MNLLALGQKVLAAQPFSALLGTEIILFTPKKTELALNITDEIKQQHGFVHGGVLSYLADNALTFAGGAALGGGGVVTNEMKINYLRPAVGDRLIARAEAIYAGRSQAVCRCDVYAVKDGVESLCAAAQGTIAALPAPK